MSVHNKQLKAGFLMANPKAPNPNSKKIAQTSHKFIVLGGLMLETLDELKANTAEADEIREVINRLTNYLESYAGRVEKLSHIRSSTYLQGITNKIDTIIRKDYKIIEE